MFVTGLGKESFGEIATELREILLGEAPNSADHALRSLMTKKRIAQQARAKRTREELLRAAERVFSHRHYAVATVDEITAAASVSKGAFYFHFRTKEDVLVALARDWSQAVATGVQELTPRGGLERGALRNALDKLFSAGRPTWPPHLILELLSQASHSEQVGNAFAGAQDAWRSAAVKLVQKARRSGIVSDSLSPDATAAALLAIRNGSIVDACLPRSGKPTDTRAATKAALALLGPEPQPLRRAS